MNKFASVVIRYHKGADLELLKQALLSVSIQSYPHMQIVLMTQNLSDEDLKALKSTLQLYLFDQEKSVLANPKLSQVRHSDHVIVNLKSKKDARASLLNGGIKYSKGRYLQFLDYDDVLYQNATAFLIEKLKAKTTGVAVGGCRRAEVDVRPNKTYVIKGKTSFIDKKISILDQLIENHLPIHSFIIDRQIVSDRDLYINESMLVLEDYEFLLRLHAKYLFDFSGMSVPVCEYRFRNDCSNSTPFFDKKNKKKIDIWETSRAKIFKLKRALKLTMTFDEIARIHSE